MRVALACSLSLSIAGCASFWDPYPSLGAQQDAINRKINAQYDPALPQKLPTDNEERGLAVYAKDRADDWKSFTDLFRRRPPTFRDAGPAPVCPRPDLVLICTQSAGCQCGLPSKTRWPDEATR